MVMCLYVRLCASEELFASSGQLALKVFFISEEKRTATYSASRARRLVGEDNISQL